jgi:hypothetical protein
MSLPVSQEIATNNPYLESVYATDNQGKFGHFLQCALSQEFCAQITDKTVLHCQDVDYRYSVAKSLEPQIISCAECPVYRNSFTNGQPPKVTLSRSIIPDSEFLV